MYVTCQVGGVCVCGCYMPSCWNVCVYVRYQVVRECEDVSVCMLHAKLWECVCGCVCV